MAEAPSSSYLQTTSNPALGAAPLPSSQVGQYVNQQIIGAQNRQSQQAMPGQSQLNTRQTPTATPVSLAGPASSLDVAIKNVSDQNQRLSGMVQQQRQQSQSNGGSGGFGSNNYGVPAGVTGERAQAVRFASNYVGSRYVLGGTSRSGIDCSGLVMAVYNQLGFNVSQHSATWQRDNIPGVRTNNLSQLRPGDIIAWRDGSHIAIYAGNGEIIEAANERVGTVRRQLWANPSAVVGIMLRFPGE